MREQVIEILARFMRRPGEQILDDTPLDRSTVGSSLMLYRMYATLAAETGLPAINPAKIDTVRTLLQAYSAVDMQPPISRAAARGRAISSTALNGSHKAAAALPEPHVGIDVQITEALPGSLQDPFYIRSFTACERAFCEAQADPRTAYCGRFAAKEALIKCGAVPPETPLADIEIATAHGGGPSYPGASVSISHAPLFSVAVAVRIR